MVVDTGNGENEKEKVRSNMVANSSNSQKSDKPPTKKTKKSITREEAAELLASAIAYCNQAGFVVTGHNYGLSLRLQIHGLNYSDDNFVVTSEEVTTKDKEK